MGFSPRSPEDCQLVARILRNHIIYQGYPEYILKMFGIERLEESEIDFFKYTVLPFFERAINGIVYPDIDENIDVENDVSEKDNPKKVIKNEKEVYRKYLKEDIVNKKRLRRSIYHTVCINLKSLLKKAEKIVDHDYYKCLECGKCRETDSHVCSACDSIGSFTMTEGYYIITLIRGLIVNYKKKEE